jgi:hypothetical protein
VFDVGMQLGPIQEVNIVSKFLKHFKAKTFTELCRLKDELFLSRCSVEYQSVEKLENALSTST